MNFLFDTNEGKQENYKLKIKTGKCQTRMLIHTYKTLFSSKRKNNTKALINRSLNP